MNLPDIQQLDDAAWQLDYATQAVAPLLAQLQARPEPTDPAARATYEADRALLRALQFYFTAANNRLELQQQVVDEMNKEMGAARWRYREMRLAHDFSLHEAQTASARYYADNDIFLKLLARTQDAARPPQDLSESF